MNYKEGFYVLIIHFTARTVLHRILHLDIRRKYHVLPRPLKSDTGAFACAASPYKRRAVSGLQQRISLECQPEEGIHLYSLIASMSMGPYLSFIKLSVFYLSLRWPVPPLLDSRRTSLE